jgi:hypothetical protein
MSRKFSPTPAAKNAKVAAHHPPQPQRHRRNDQPSDATPRPSPPIEQQNRDNFGAGIFPEI